MTQGSESRSAPKARKMLVDRSDSTLPFPFKLHHLLEEAEDCCTDHIISWLPSGEAFKIHDPEAFADTVMTKYFKQTKLKSFTRQLYIYGFTKISKGPNLGGFFHPEFRRDDQKACLTLSRRDGKEDRRVKKNRPKMLEDLQRSLAKSKPTSGICSKSPDLPASLPSIRNMRLPQSLLSTFPTSLPLGNNGPSMEGAPRPKKAALTLFDQTFGDDLDMDDIFGSPSLGPISSLETRALPGPPGSLRLDFSKQPLPRPAFPQWNEEPKNVELPWKAPQQVTSAPMDPFGVEPRSIEEMVSYGFADEGLHGLASHSFMGHEHMAESFLQPMEI